MAGLLPEWLGKYCNNEESKARKKKPSVTNILEWLQCFTVYVAVQGQKQPECIQDLMGYQALIIDAYLEYKSTWWIGYDQFLQQIAASEPGRSWASVDPTLWNLICFQWNENVSAMCPYPNCKFQYIYATYISVYNPIVTDVAHKALYCPKRHCLSTSLATSGSTSRDISLNLSCKFETSYFHNYIIKLAG